MGLLKANKNLLGKALLAQAGFVLVAGSMALAQGEGRNYKVKVQVAGGEPQGCMLQIGFPNREKEPYSIAGCDAIEFTESIGTISLMAVAENGDSTLGCTPTLPHYQLSDSGVNQLMLALCDAPQGPEAEQAEIHGKYCSVSSGIVDDCIASVAQPAVVPLDKDEVYEEGRYAAPADSSMDCSDTESATDCFVTSRDKEFALVDRSILANKINDEKIIVTDTLVEELDLNVYSNLQQTTCNKHEQVDCYVLGTSEYRAVDKNTSVPTDPCAIKKGVWVGETQGDFPSLNCPLTNLGEERLPQYFSRKTMLAEDPNQIYCQESEICSESPTPAEITTSQLMKSGYNQYYFFDAAGFVVHQFKGWNEAASNNKVPLASSTELKHSRVAQDKGFLWFDGHPPLVESIRSSQVRKGVRLKQWSSAPEGVGEIIGTGDFLTGVRVHNDSSQEIWELRSDIQGFPIEIEHVPSGRVLYVMEKTENCAGNQHLASYKELVSFYLDSLALFLEGKSYSGSLEVYSSTKSELDTEPQRQFNLSTGEQVDSSQLKICIIAPLN